MEMEDVSFPKADDAATRSSFEKREWVMVKR
jgi:hypothetical protein